MIECETSGSISLKPLESYFTETMSGRIVAKVSSVFARYLKKESFGGYFKDITGKTRESIGFYRFKGKNPAYAVKAGAGVPGNLNYLSGLYRGRAVSQSGKAFEYSRKRDMLEESWAKWGGYSRAAEIGEEVMKKHLGDMEAQVGS